MNSESSIAVGLLNAVAKARALKGKNLVIKLGGSAMDDATTARGTLEAIAALHTLGIRIVLVHGGGKAIDRAMADAGLTPKKVLGRRITDAETLNIVTRVLIDETNVALERQLRELGAHARGFHGGSDCIIEGELLTLPGPDGQPVDLGRVGRVTQVHPYALLEYLAEGWIPILPSVAADSPRATMRGGDPHLLNVNADTIASAVAGAVKAEACYFLTDTPGVLRDVREPASLIPRLTLSECRNMMNDGIIAGGMIPKVEACFEALSAGSARAVILDGRNPQALLNEFVSNQLTGTEIIP